MLSRTLMAMLVGLPLSAMSTHAADMDGLGPLRGSLAPVKRAHRSGEWTGFHIGGLTGYEWLDSSGNSWDGLAAGFYGGFDYQIGQIVIGAETDFTFTTAERFNGVFAHEQNWAGSLRARLGMAVDNYLFFGTGGLAYSQAEVGLPLFGQTDRATHLGWTIGGGVEALIAKNLSARLEYRYADYGSENFKLVEPISGTLIEGDLDLETHAVMAGIGVRF